jgi:hypothetical protein
MCEPPVRPSSTRPGICTVADPARMRKRFFSNSARSLSLAAASIEMDFPLFRVAHFADAVTSRGGSLALRTPRLLPLHNIETE